MLLTGAHSSPYSPSVTINGNTINVIPNAVAKATLEAISGSCVDYTDWMSPSH